MKIKGKVVIEFETNWKNLKEIPKMFIVDKKNPTRNDIIDFMEETELSLCEACLNDAMLTIFENTIRIKQSYTKIA